jgi:YD repeat-containing protein
MERVSRRLVTSFIRAVRAGALRNHPYRLVLGLCILLAIIYTSKDLSNGALARSDSDYDLSEPVPTAVAVHWVVGRPDPVTGAVPEQQSPFYGHGNPFHWEVNLSDGLFIDHQTDFYLPDMIPINLTRTYRMMDERSRSFGKGTSDSYELFLAPNSAAFTHMDLILPDGTKIFYRRLSPGIGYIDAVYLHTATSGVFFGSMISWNGHGWDLRTTDGTIFGFRDLAEFSGGAALTSISDSRGNTLTIKRDSLGNKLRITSPQGGTLLFRHDRFNRIVEARDNEGHVARYTYDPGGRLETVKDIAGGLSHYSYNTADEMVAITNPNGRVWMRITYDQRDRVVAQDILTGRKSRRYFYSSDTEGRTATADVVFEDGTREHHVLDSQGYEAVPVRERQADRTDYL